MIRAGQIRVCDRCERTADADADLKSPDYTGPKPFVLVDKTLQGGPVLDLCRVCRHSVEEFARGIER